MSGLGKRLVKRAFAAVGYEVRKLPELYNSEIFGSEPLKDMFLLYRLEGGGEHPVIFDVGANIGEFISSFRETFDTPVIHAFEPGPEIFKKLGANTLGMSDVKLNNIGLAAEARDMVFLENDHSKMSSFLDPGQDCWGRVQRQIKVHVGTVDDYCNENGIAKIEILKCDTQGYDLEVMRGADRMMREGRIHLIFTELNCSEMYKGQAELDEIYRFLREHQFRLVTFYRFAYQDNRAGWTDALFARDVRPATAKRIA
jgi:FkbM family methyltransferase